ncbi:lutropin-choriogonadotropic hormone receptor-like isoform X2 [Cloeon dipterum]|uniref:lutropin-choriogonadotropic hormone receptor-like isoform X2 n=1 Tax=Cloeon dipterum TaxID=197152 RepID=UPI003220902C
MTRLAASAGVCLLTLLHVTRAGHLGAAAVASTAVPDNTSASLIYNTSDASIAPFIDPELQAEPCGCWNTTEDGREVEVECKCGGPRLTYIPTDLAKGVQRISLVNAALQHIPSDAFQPYRSTLQDIVLLKLRSLDAIEEGAFENLTELRTVYIDHAPLLTSLPNRLFHTHLPSLKIIRIVHTGITTLPHLSGLKTNSILHMVDLENNRITKVTSNAIRVRTEHFLLNYNKICEVEDYAFNESEIAKLSLKGNKALVVIRPEAFVGLKSLRELDLSETSISQLPSKGLKEIEILRLENTWQLKEIPSIYNFEYLKAAFLNYAYHCCAFQFPAKHDPQEFEKHQRFVQMIQDKYCKNSAGNRSKRASNASRDDGFGEFGRVVYSPDNMSTPQHTVPDWGMLEQQSPPNFDPYFLDPHLGFGQVSDSGAPGGFASEDSGVFHQAPGDGTPHLVHAYCGNLSRALRDVKCSPTPDAFNPCEDLMGNWWLRVSSWLVVLAAVFGNLAVLVVLLSSRFRMTVPKFLMCNLAFADLCMGTYLLMIAAMDVHSMGIYFNYAIDWQEGYGCQVAGFLTVFASELSIFTLTLITSERWYAITYALHLDKRLKLFSAAKIMALGWLYSITMATLPLLGISGYSKTSICLPMDNTDLEDQVYLLTLLLVNGLAFVLICGCYLKIYCTISGHNTIASRTDTTVAKRMALLVFTDFACWAPIAFFGLTAVAGYPLIDVTGSKVLLVFFYPLNSCANPYLYAILTKQYRRDLRAMCSRRSYCTKKPAKVVAAASAISQPVRNTYSTGPQQPNSAADLRPLEQRRASSTAGGREASGREASSSSSRSKGSPHPLRNSTTKLHITGEQEMLLRRAVEQAVLPDPHSAPEPYISSNV